MKINIKKSLKFITLLISALLIGTASAAIYYSLSISGTITTAVTVCFGPGADFPAGSQMGTGNTSVTLALKAYPNTTLTYGEALKINNTQSGTPSVRLRYISITNGTADVGNFAFVNIVLLDDSSVQKGYLNFTVSGNYFILTSDTDYEQMDSSDVWSILIETKATADAQAGISVSLQIAVDVQE
ncbi:MAG: hypothetical protein QW270_08890 [Candidatus Bathyarchaeia archaeon]